MKILFYVILIILSNSNFSEMDIMQESIEMLKNNISMITSISKHSSELVSEDVENEIEVIDTNEIMQILNMTKVELEELCGEKLSKDKGTVSIIESSMLFPMLYYDRYNISIIFRNDNENTKPIMISIEKKSALSSIEISGKKLGNTFDDLKNDFNVCNVEKTWRMNKDIKVYKLLVDIDNLKYTFISNGEKEDWDILNIQLE